MDKKKKLIRTAGSFTLEERKQIIQEYLLGGQTKTQIWYKHTGQKDEHGNINRWMRQLGLTPTVRPVLRMGKKSSSFVPDITTPVEKNKIDQSAEELKQRIKELEQQLETARLKAEGFEIMIDIAEKELNIPIRKKSDTK